MVNAIIVYGTKKPEFLKNVEEAVNDGYEICGFTIFKTVHYALAIKK